MSEDGSVFCLDAPAEKFTLNGQSLNLFARLPAFTAISITMRAKTAPRIINSFFGFFFFGTAAEGAAPILQAAMEYYFNHYQRN